MIVMVVIVIVIVMVIVIVTVTVTMMVTVMGIIICYFASKVRHTTLSAPELDKQNKSRNMSYVLQIFS